MGGALDRLIAWESEFVEGFFSDPTAPWSPLKRALLWCVLGMVMGLVIEWEYGWHSTEQTVGSMIGVGLICASISLVWSFAKFALATATLRLLGPEDELVSGVISAPPSEKED